MRFLDFSSWQNILFMVIGLALFTLISMGIRLAMMFTIQQRRERANRQINERLKTLIAAYKTLGGSFTGTLTVDPTHLRELRAASDPEDEAPDGLTTSERRRRIRDAVEAALSDIILLGTEEQVRLAAEASRDLVAGRHVHTDRLVASLRAFIRQALDLAPVPEGVEIPPQGPTRPSGGGGGRDRSGGATRGGGGGGGMGGGAGGGGGAALGTVGLGSSLSDPPG